MNRPASKAFDLTSILPGLHPIRHKALIRGIRAFHAVVSVTLDLNHVRMSVDTLRGLDIADTSHETSQLGSALLTHAVVIYARATHSKAVDRYQVGVTGAYHHAALKAKHEEIIRMRDKSIAHFGPGKNRWNDDRVVLLEQDKGSALTVVHHRTNLAGGVVEDLDTLLSAAIPHVLRLQKDRAGELDDALVRADQEANDLIDKHEFDVAAFYQGSAELVANFWGQAAFTQTRIAADVEALGDGSEGHF
ncbi:hypothetical protein CO731_01683 [Aminobacter sp. MSH1]|uniref:hypothetical protein n=1 Tax=Aminobacter sp. MSH1 TaxID=374606 RepID=UPI000D346E91|nr:hypothetical protein [Aminobacter sp. MSH1]AWC22227.1 hypothetical protein CO731_01683 [Aminobacter sp. MSH1]